ncbi:hypothetical protein [Pseudohongiella sp. O18]|uniref:hypothetical protein n=1 Tax=Pseudohongiella sp. O18 TaxID=2904248 RepID=UPI001F2512DB|nr:hypothetical protein [Pseudohongiella sp. O18]
MKTPIKTSPLVALATAVALGCSSFAIAQETFTVSGPLYYAYYSDSQTGEYNYLYDGSFTATVTHTPSVPFQFYTYSNQPYYSHSHKIWENAVVSIEFQVFDASGNLVNEYQHGIQTPDYGTNYALSEALNYGPYYGYNSHMTEYFYRNSTTYSPVYQYEYAYVGSWQQFDDNTTLDLSEDALSYPDLSDSLDWTDNTAYMEFYSGGIYNYMYGAFDTFGGGDTDGDGISDSEDACVGSDLAATVVIGNSNTGVKNTLLENGCTITDMIVEIQLVAERHGSLVSGVAHFLNAIVSDGTITGREKGKIQSAIAKSKEKGNGKGK